MTLDEKYGNRRYALKLVNVYKALLAKYTDGTDIPEEYYSLNPYR